MRKKDSLLYYLNQMNSAKTRRVIIVPDEEGQLIASLQEEQKGKWVELNRAYLDIRLYNQEDALPLVSKVEWDETTGQVQAPIPVKYLLKSQKPRTSTHQFGYKRGRPDRVAAGDKIIEEIKSGEREPMFGWQAEWAEKAKKK